MQRSEGGGLGMGGSPSGLMSARGAADFLTRATAVLATNHAAGRVAMRALRAAGTHTDIDERRAAAAAPGKPRAMRSCGAGSSLE